MTAKCPEGSRQRVLLLMVAVACLALHLASPIPAWAHADIHERISALTKQIQQDPNNASLYLKRGELHRVHRDWDAALVDYQRAAELDPDLDTVYLARGRMLFEAGRFPEAKIDIDRFLATHPEHREGLLTRARVFVKLGRGLEASEEYSHAIALLSHPTPEYYLERAQALAQEGDEYVERALRGLDEGIEKLGPLVTLQLFAVDLELKRQRYDAALARLDGIAQWLAKERWLHRRGRILQRAGRNEAARQAFSQALARIESLSSGRRSSKPIAELELQLRAGLKQLEAGSSVQ